MGSKLENIAKSLSKAVATGGTLLKVLVRSRRPSAPGKPTARRLALLGNGPSLRKTLEENPEWLSGSDRLAVNFAANAPAFREIAPRHYVLADPHFFEGVGRDPNVGKLWRNLSAADWGMTLHVPCGREMDVARLLGAGAGGIEVKTFNLTPAEGADAVCHLLYDRGLAMPRPRNVLIPSIMVALREGYRDIYLAGADHSWLQTLWVDDDNNVVSVQPHFYADDDKEKERVRSEYRGYHLHDILGSMTVAFRSYFRIARYAERIGARIVNATPGSYIDAFPRLKSPAGL